jgi:hypothetical protein
LKEIYFILELRIGINYAHFRKPRNTGKKDNITTVPLHATNSTAVIISCFLKVYDSKSQCCGSESGSESERIRAFLAGTESESEIFVPDSDPDPVPDPVI